MSEIVPHTGAVTGAGVSPVVELIFRALLESIQDGRLQPGDHISDAALSKEFAVSRTPVREAIQHLRNLGLVEAAAGRYTRVAIVTPQQTAHALVVWVALYTALVDEVAEHTPDSVRAAMAHDHSSLLAVLADRNYQQIADLTFSFFEHLMGVSQNPILVSNVIRVVHLIRLGSLHLPEAIDLEALARAQAQLLEALTSGDPDHARHAVELIRSIRVPLN